MKDKQETPPIEIGINKVEVTAIPTERINLTINLNVCANGTDINFKKIPELLDKINKITL